MILLQTADFESSEVVLVHEAFDGGGEGGDGGGDRHAADHSLAAHLDFIDHGFGAGLAGVHDPLDFLVVDEVQQVRAAAGNAEHGAGLDAFVVEHGGGAAGGVEAVAQFHQLTDQGHCAGLVLVLEGDEDVALARDAVAGGQLALEVGKAAVAIQAHDFTGGLHFRGEGHVNARENAARRAQRQGACALTLPSRGCFCNFTKGNTASFTLTYGTWTSSVKPISSRVSPSMQRLA